MSTWLFVPLVIIAGAACPLHMWWQQRRGRQAACCPPRRVSDDDTARLEALHQRQRELAGQIEELVSRDDVRA